MYNKKEETQRINKWIDKLNSVHRGWVNGDLEFKNRSTADMLNHSLKVAIELKREKGDPTDNNNKNIETTSNRIQNFFSSVNKKFSFYPNYKTILIIEMLSNITIGQKALEGIKQLHFTDGNLVGGSIRNKNLYSQMENIGAVVFLASTK